MNANDILASCSASEISSMQSEHYRLDSAIRTLTDNFTVEQKRELVVYLSTKVGKN